jgi:flagellar biogenesis protein FliO
LRLVETLSLGDKRFVSIVKVDGEQFLLGGSASSLILLAKLDGSNREPTDNQEAKASFGEVFSHMSGKARTRVVHAVEVPFEEGI